MRDRRLFSQRMSSCAVPAHRASLLPASMLQTLFGHRQASWGHGTLWTLIHALRQADRQASHRAIGTVTAKDKRVSSEGQICLNLVKRCKQLCAWMFFFFYFYQLKWYISHCFKVKTPRGLLLFTWGEKNLITSPQFAYFKTAIHKMQRAAIQIIKWGNRKAGSQAVISNSAACDECCSLWGP